MIPRLLLRPLAFVLLTWLAVPLAHAQAAEDVTLEATDGTSVTIDRDEYGVPHITAETEAAAFFGQGFAVAQDRLFQMETFWRTATGRLAELDPNAVNQDLQIRTVFYTPTERQELFEELPPELQTMLSSYVDGINAYIDSTAANPDAYLPFEYTQQPLNVIGIEPWDIDKAVAVIQFFIRRFGEIGGLELVRLAELQANGEAWFNENRPVNEPEAPVTLHVNPPGGADVEPVAYRGPEIDPALAEEVLRRRAELEASLDAHGVPRKFGSFAAVVSGALSESGNVMLLGAPQMGQPQQASKAVTSEVELLVGEAGNADLHVAGMTVPGIPGVIIGRNEGRTWTFTTGVTDNTDTYIEFTDEAFQQYLYEGEFQPFEVITETVDVIGGDPVEYTHLRTVHGPVYLTDVENRQAFTYKYAFWMRELEMAEALYGAWKAESVEGFRAAAEATPVSFNFFYADKEQNIAYWHVGDYPVRPGNTDPRLPLLGDGSEEWIGFRPFASHPQAINPPQGYFVNWNNKPAAWWNQGDNVSWRMGAGRVYDGVTFLDAHLQESLPVSYEELQQLTCVVRSNPEYQEYPGTYQQAVEFSQSGSYAENVIPPGQSGFVNAAGVPSPNFADQWAFYQSSVACDEVEMKPFTFIGANPVADEPGAVPAASPALGVLYPNPVTASALTVRFELPERETARVEVIDLLGRTVAVLADGSQPAGPQTATLDASVLPSGVYFVRLRAGDVTQTRKLTVVR